MSPAKTTISSISASNPQQNTRLGRLDIARGLALIAMAVYHFGWDLEFFGYLVQGSASQGWWRIFARCIASSFLFLVGFSLVLAHGRGIRWRPFMHRLAQVTSAALAISALTWFAMPDAFIFFGILHQIALASVLGLVFLRVPVWITLPLAVLIIAAPHFACSEIFDHPALWWVGLSTVDPVSNDYVPVFPWFGAVLIGIAGAKLMQASGLISLLRGGMKPRWLQNGLTLIGKHSLIFYLVHQPVLLGCLYVFALIMPPSPAMQTANFVAQCNRQCTIDSDPQLCQNYCGCMIETIQTQNLNAILSKKQISDADRSTLGDIANQCAIKIQTPIQ